jgi:hypothetical protein
VTEIIRRPSRLDLSLRTHDDVVLPFRFATEQGPLDITGWEFEGERAEVTVVDAAAGRVEVTIDTSTRGVASWSFTRLSPLRRGLLAGRHHISDSAAKFSTPDAEWTLLLTEAGDLTLEAGETIDSLHRGSGRHVDDLTAVDGGVL